MITDPAAGGGDVGDGDVAGLWRVVDELAAELPEAGRRAVYTAVAIGVADGWRPTRTEIANLVAFGAQQTSATLGNAERHTRVSQSS